MSVSHRGFTDRYHAVGLERNPFAAAQQPAAGDFDCAKLFVSRGLPDLPPPYAKALVQVIGDEGMGKSSQLRQWATVQPGPFHYVPNRPYRSRWAPPPRPADSAGTIYADELDRMPVTLRARWFAATARDNITLVAAAHSDLSSAARRWGFDVFTHVLTPVDRIKLRSIVERRLRAFAHTSANPTIHLDDAMLDHVIAESGGNPRAAEVLLHRLVADLVSTASGRA